jgi:hypothetical protein
VKPFARSTSQRAAAVVAALGLLAIGFLPLFGGPGYEISLAAGLLLPTAAAIATALDVVRSEETVAPLALIGRGVGSGLSLAALGFVTALVHGLRISAVTGSLAAGFCDLGGGALGYALTGGAGAVMGGAWGAVAGLIVRTAKRPRLACTLAGIAVPLGSALVSVARFYTSPMIFAFDPFAGYFSGTLYDTVIDAGTPLLTYRLGSLCTLVALALLASVTRRDERGAFHLVDLRASSGSRARLALGLVVAVASAGVTVEGAALGHWQTTATIKSALGGFRSGARCDVVYPDGERPDQTELLVRDCEEELAHDEAVLGTRFEGRITAFFFRDANEKKHFMGAGDTYIAKPWRREVYLQLHSYPHPVLGHEIAHVVAGGFARGPFRVTGAFDGWWPNPGLIEGIAVAASPDEDELTHAQWAHAMMDLGILPPMRAIFSFGFLGESSAKSYTLAGAFVEWVLGKWGTEVIRRWYGGEPITSLVQMDWDALDAAFRAWIGVQPLGPEAKAYAKGRFDRPSVFGRTCPHVVDALRRDADGCRDALRIDRARQLYGEVLVRDAHDWGARLGLGIMELRFGDGPRGESELASLAKDRDVPRGYRDRTEEALADADLLSRDPAGWARAQAAYDSLAHAMIDEDAARTLEVKAYAATRGEARVALLALLVGAPARPVDVVDGLVRVASWARASGDPVAEYVLGKNLANRELWREAGEHLDAAITAGVPTPRIARELLKQRAVTACALGDKDEAHLVRERVESSDGPFVTSTGRRAWLLGFLDRCGATATAP